MEQSKKYIFEEFKGRDYFNKSRFILKVVLAHSGDMIAKYDKEQGKESKHKLLPKTLKKKINDLHDYLGNLLFYLEELEVVIKFMKVSPKKIKAITQFEIDKDDYYLYNYDNFIIRIISSLDLCSQIGNLVYDLKLKGYDCNYSRFANHVVIKDSPAAEILSRLATFLNKIKKARNEKIHYGKNSTNRIEDIVFWDSTSKLLPNFFSDKTLKELNAKTEAELRIVAIDVQSTIHHVCQYIVEFLDSMMPQLETMTDIVSEVQ